MTVVIKGKGIVEFLNETDAKLNQEMQLGIRNAPTGSKLYFEYIKCRNETGDTYLIPPSAFILK